MAKKKIYLSPSMQKPNVYAYGDTNEMEQCNKIASYAEVALKRCGFDVKRAPKGQDMYVSIKESNNWGADLHIPIHTNAYNGKVTGGTLVMLYDNRAENVKAGEAILRSVAGMSPGNDYSLRFNSQLAELNSTSAVAVYLEVEFHDTREGAEWIVRNVRNIGEAVAKGVCDYYAVKFVPENTTVNFEAALLQILLRMAHKEGICKTLVKPVDNKKGKLTNAALAECKNTLGYKNSDTSIDLDFVRLLEEEITRRQTDREMKLSGDFNKDGVLNIRDVTNIQKHLSGMEDA